MHNDEQRATSDIRLRAARLSVIVRKFKSLTVTCAQIPGPIRNEKLSLSLGVKKE